MKDKINMSEIQPFVVLISANAEWGVVRNNFPNCLINSSPFGDWFKYYYQAITDLPEPVIFFHGGWGKVSASASTQYVIDRWHPRMVVNIGTCGGFESQINKGEVILVEKTVIYDIYEQMGDPDEHIQYYMTELDNSWIALPFPIKVRQSLLVSGDRDLFSNDIPQLICRYGAIAGDWESGSIAWVSKKNNTQCLILRGVTDLVGASGGEAYDGNVSFYHESTNRVMRMLLDTLPDWLLKVVECDSK